MSNQQKHTHQPDHDADEKPGSFAVEPTLFMILMAEKGSDHIRKIHFLFRNSHFWTVELKDGREVTIDHGANMHKAVLAEDKQNGLVGHIMLGEVPCLDRPGVAKLFHILWDKAVDDKDYDKEQWLALARILYERGFDNL